MTKIALVWEPGTEDLGPLLDEIKARLQEDQLCYVQANEIVPPDHAVILLLGTTKQIHWPTVLARVPKYASITILFHKSCMPLPAVPSTIRNIYCYDKHNVKATVYAMVRMLERQAQVAKPPTTGGSALSLYIIFWWMLVFTLVAFGYGYMLATYADMSVWDLCRMLLKRIVTFGLTNVD